MVVLYSCDHTFFFTNIETGTLKPFVDFVTLFAKSCKNVSSGDFLSGVILSDKVYW